MPSIPTRLDAIGVTWLLRSRDGERIVPHHGGRVGQQSTFTLVPGRNFAITVRTNTNSGVQLGNEVTDWTLERVLGVPPQPLMPVQADLALVTEFVGTYV